MKNSELVRLVWARAEELCGPLGLSVWDVSFDKEGKERYLSVVIDRDTGVSIDDCEAVSRGLDPFLDEPRFDSLPSYTLTVSSAGLQRRLTRPEHFRWAIGREVELSFYRSRDGRSSVSGELLRYDGESVTLAAPDGEETVPLTDVALARLVFTF